MEKGQYESNLIPQKFEPKPKSEAEKKEESRLTHENVLRVYSNCQMGDGETGVRVPEHPRFGRNIFSQDTLNTKEIKKTIEQFASQLPDIFSSENGGDSKYAKNIKDISIEEGIPWTSDTKDSLMLLSLIQAIGLGIVDTPLYMDKYYKPKERGSFLFKINWKKYEQDKREMEYTYGGAK